MPLGKPAGVRCVQLDAVHRCRLFGKPERPDICGRLRPQAAMCGSSRDQALAILVHLESATAPVIVAGAG